MPQGENLRFELNTRPIAGPEGGEEGGKQRGHAGLERDQPPVRIRNGDKRFGVSGRDTPPGAEAAGCIRGPRAPTHGQRRKQEPLDAFSEAEVLLPKVAGDDAR
jgi:hypothetical protein